MRTTVTLDPDTAQLIQRRMRERGISFKEAINDAIRRSESKHTEHYEMKTFSLGEPLVNLDRALQIAAELEDEELIRRAQAD